MSDENRIERLEKQMEQYQSRISSLEEQLEEIQTPSVTRRTALGALGLAGLGTAGGATLARRAAAQESSGGSIGTAENPLGEIYVDDLYQNEEHIYSDTVRAENGIYNAVYSTTGDISSDLEEEGVQVHTQSDGPVIYEGGWESIGGADVEISEAGVVDHGTVDADSNSDSTVSFTESYGSPPIVISSFGSTQVWTWEGLHIVSEDIDTDGFRSVVYNTSDSEAVLDRVGYLVIRQ